MIKNKFDDFDRVENKFKAFIHALVWESFDICACEEDTVVNEFIETYCKAKGKEMIEDIYYNVEKYSKEFDKRYEITLYRMSVLDGNCEDEEKCYLYEWVTDYNTDNLSKAYEVAAQFYRDGNEPCVKIFDSVEGKLVCNWKSLD